MTEQLREERAQSFRNERHLWITVSHFLSADLLVELFDAVVSESAHERFAFTDLVKVEVSKAPPHLSSLSIDYHRHPSSLGQYLQRFIEVLVLQNDRSANIFERDADADDMRTMEALEFALGLAHADFGIVENFLRTRSNCPKDIKPLIVSLGALANPQIVPKTLNEVEAALLPVQMPLQAIVIKHLGDLCADADRSEIALSLYHRSEELIRQADFPAWQGLLRTFGWMVFQSRAAMIRVLQGPAASADLLLRELKRTPYDEAPLLHINATVDGINAEILGAPKLAIPNLTRPDVLLAPTVLVSHDLETALSYWRSKNFGDAYRCFWAVLRRQIALGSATEMRKTKSLFGMCILEDLSVSVRRHRKHDSFALALRLLIESEDADMAAKTEWSDDLLQAYLDKKAVAAAQDQAVRAPGAQNERLPVLVALYAAWLKQLPRDSDELGQMLIGFLASLAKDRPWSITSRCDLARRSFKALEEVAEHRPEFRKLASQSVADAILAKLAEKNFHARWSALDAALAFAEGFETNDLRRCVCATLDVLDEIEPAEGAWPVVRPALGLISDSAAQSLWSQDPELGRRCAAAVVRFGLQAESENVRLLFLLKDLGPYLDIHSEDGERLAAVVADLRRRARGINSSEVIGCIAALLEVPTVTRVEGVQDAVAGLIEILTSVQRNGPSIGLSYAYQPLLQLARRADRFADELQIGQDEVRQLLRPLADALESLWKEVSKNPLIFAPFAIPARSAPDPVVVHNWTFASLAFAEAMNLLPEMRAAMSSASNHPMLATNMAVAAAIRLPVDGTKALDIEAIRNEPSAAFYSALGQRIILLETQSGEQRQKVLAALVDQCFKHGPDGLDAGILALAVSSGLRMAGDAITRQEYAARVSRHRTLSLSLAPLIRALSE